jgi:cytochrome b involved in lipid metabolism
MLWVKFEGIAYDVTALSETHPGGKDIFLELH